MKQKSFRCVTKTHQESSIYGATDGKVVGTYDIRHVIFVDKNKTADFQLTTAIQKILTNDGNKDDLLALFMDRNLPIDDVMGSMLAEEILKCPPKIGYLTISNALQWRLQYGRVIDTASIVDGIDRVL